MDSADKVTNSEDGGGDSGEGGAHGGGVLFDVVVQGRPVTVELAGSVPPEATGLPAPSGAFAGRAAELAELVAVLDPAADRGAEGQRVVLVTAVPGLAGVGVTEVVVQAALRVLAEPGWFPGGVLFTDLDGHDPDPDRRRVPHRVLDGWLRALGMPPEHIPDQLPGRVSLFREVLAAYAEQGRRLLVVVDNAESETRTRALLPADPHTAALVTCRRTMDIAARRHEVAALGPAASVEVLRQALHQLRGPADTRVDDAPEDALHIAESCAGLPLALRITAALLAKSPAQPLAAMADALRAEHTRLDPIRHPGSEQAVRAAFDLAYAHLTPRQARLFRLLPLNAGPHVSTRAAARLIGQEEQNARELLSDLARAHLVVRLAGSRDHWRLHDQIRDYAEELGREHAETDHPDDAAARLLDHYLATARAADARWETRDGAPYDHAYDDVFADRAQAVAWLDAERANLLTAATVTAPRHDHPAETDLAAVLARYFVHGRHFDDCTALVTAAAEILHERGDLTGSAAMLTNLGAALIEASRHDAAVTALTAAAAVHRATADHQGEAIALNNLGLAELGAGRHDEAVTALAAAATLHRAAAAHADEAAALSNLGAALMEARRYDEAIAILVAAGHAYRAVGDTLGEDQTLEALEDAHARRRQSHRPGTQGEPWGSE
ncbi:tetratricopeptide repeat protein [Streptomyces sp. NBC_00448]|uniref:tetratricopeptide repeat protein n=1 Tax=Streptomyces sp. NBC_00448 TaxID=2903652 RepID=UPI002E1D1179